jgi:hypothetical protein
MVHGYLTIPRRSSFELNPIMAGRRTVLHIFSGDGRVPLERLPVLVLLRPRSKLTGADLLAIDPTEKGSALPRLDLSWPANLAGN